MKYYNKNIKSTRPEKIGNRTREHFLEAYGKSKKIKSGSFIKFIGPECIKLDTDGYVKAALEYWKSRNETLEPAEKKALLTRGAYDKNTQSQPKTLIQAKLTAKKIKTKNTARALPSPDLKALSDEEIIQQEAKRVVNYLMSFNKAMQQIKKNEIDPYKLFGISKNTPKEQIKITWRALSRIFHPDKHMDKATDHQQVFTQIFQILNEAYEKLPT